MANLETSSMSADIFPNTWSSVSRTLACLLPQKSVVNGLEKAAELQCLSLLDRGDLGTAFIPEQVVSCSKGLTLCFLVLLQPDTLGALPNLRELWLDRNQLSALPPVSTHSVNVALLLCSLLHHSLEPGGVSFPLPGAGESSALGLSGCV